MIFLPIPRTVYAYMALLLLVLWPFLLLIWPPSSDPAALVIVLIVLNTALFVAVQERCASQDCSLLTGFKIMSVRLSIGCANVSILYVPVVLVGVYLACVFYTFNGLRRNRSYTQCRWLNLVYKFVDKG